jgi:hypothetical protein
MQEIYRHASDALIWLGNPLDAKLAVFRTSMLHLEIISYDDSTRAEKLHAHIWAQRVSQNESFRALSAMLHHPYWSRHWIVQERNRNSISIVYLLWQEFDGLGHISASHAYLWGC